MIKPLKNVYNSEKNINKDMTKLNQNFNKNSNYKLRKLTKLKEEIKNVESSEEQFRILTRKGYVYDSYDDEENLDEIMNFNYIHPNSLIIEIIDFFVVIFTFYNLIYIPLFLAKNDIYCVVENNFSFMFYLIHFVY